MNIEQHIYNVFYPDKEFKLIAQKNGKDCGLACISIVASISYNEIARQYKEYLKGMSIAQAYKICEQLGVAKNYSYYRGERTLFKKHRRRGIYLIREKGKRYGHWVALDKYKNVYDTELVVIEQLSCYERNNWEVLAVVELN